MILPDFSFPGTAALPEPAPRNAVILHLLTSYVRVIADYQLLGWERASVRKRFRRLAELGLVNLKTAMVRPELSLAAPVFAWQPGDPPPNANRVAWRLAFRWKGSPRPVIVASATARAAIETGGPIGGRPLRRTEICHDLHVTALFLKFCKEKCDRLHLWRHEDATSTRRAARELVPDAMIGDIAIEFGGRYRAAKLRRIHRGHAEAGRPYEIW